MRSFVVNLYRPPVGAEIGPVLEREVVESKNMKNAKEFAKSIAKERGWRLLSVVKQQDPHPRSRKAL